VRSCSREKTAPPVPRTPMMRAGGYLSGFNFDYVPIAWATTTTMTTKKTMKMAMSLSLSLSLCLCLFPTLPHIGNNYFRRWPTRARFGVAHDSSVHVNRLKLSFPRCDYIDRIIKNALLRILPSPDELFRETAAVSETRQYRDLFITHRGMITNYLECRVRL